MVLTWVFLATACAEEGGVKSAMEDAMAGAGRSDASVAEYMDARPRRDASFVRVEASVDARMDGAGNGGTEDGTIDPNFEPGAFPGALGHGRFAVGGRGGKVLVVDSLDDNFNNPAPGTFRWAVSQKGPRTVVFRTGGTVELENFVRITEPYLTIAGQTAPGDGINFKNAPIEIQTHDVIVRNIRIRPSNDMRIGPTAERRDALQIFHEAHDVIVDQSSFSWSMDELLHISGPIAIAGDSKGSPTRVTIQRVIAGEALNDAGHPDGVHSKAMLLSGGHVKKVSFIQSVLANNIDRNPRLIWGADIEFINAVFYNYGKSYAAILSGTGHPVEVAPIYANFIGSHWIPGPDTPTSNGPEVRIKSDVPEQTRVYFRDNVGPRRKLGTPAGQDENVFAEGSKFLASSPAAASSGVTALSSTVSEENALRCAGALAPRPDAVDRRIVRHVEERSGGVIDTPDDYELGYPAYERGTAPIDSDEDGMADSWEKDHGLRVGTDDHAGNDLHGFYTNLEVYLNDVMEAALPFECRASY